MAEHFSHRKGGLIKKYVVFKVEGEELIPTSPDASYFVLRVDQDPFARKALQIYADLVIDTNPELSRDLYTLLDSTRESFNLRSKIDSILQDRDKTKS